MDYFFIFGNIASIAALIGFVLQIHGMSNNLTLRDTVLVTVVATLVFWIYFYFSPKNKISEKIKSRLSYSGRYRDSRDLQIDVYEGEFTTDGFSPIEVPIPPFEAAPDVTVFRKDGKTSAHSASISQVTPDVIRFSVTNS